MPASAPIQASRIQRRPASMACLRKGPILRKELVAGMNGVDVGLTRDSQDIVDVEVYGEWLFAFPRQIALVRLEEARAGHPSNRWRGCQCPSWPPRGSRESRLRSGC